MTTALAEKPEPQTPDRLIALAIEHGADVDRLGKLMDLQERWQAQQARRAYFDALSDFQNACPNVPKTKVVKNRDGSERYKYAPLDTIIKTLREPLRRHGFSYRWETAHAEESLQVTCHLMHSAGHEESATVTIPGVTGHGTNAAQDEGSAITYGRRYSLINVLGIVVDEDDDGASSGPAAAQVLMRMMGTLRREEIMDGVLRVMRAYAERNTDAAAEVIAEWTRDEFGALWVAPSKGGVWTTDIRKWLKDDQELKDKIHIRRTEMGWYDQPENAL